MSEEDKKETEENQAEEEEHVKDRPEDDDDEDSEPEKDDQKEKNKEKKKLDIDKLLKQKIKLDDGNEHYYFSRGPKYSDGTWPVNCHLCRMPLFSDEQLESHIKRKGHKRMTRFKPSAKDVMEPFFQVAPKTATSETDKHIKIYAGEIISEITPEYEDRIIKPEEFEVKPPSDPDVLKKLQEEPVHEYNEKLPVLGLCYIYKMMRKGDIIYSCTLCNTRIIKNGLAHVLAQGHQLRYNSRHFPKLYNKVSNRLETEGSGISFRDSVCNIFRKLYRKIEEEKGFRKVSIVDNEYFFQNLKKFLLKTRFDSHYDETTVEITEEEVDDLIQKCIDKVEFIKPDDVPEADEPSRDFITDRNRRRERQERTPPRKRRYDPRDDREWRRYHEILRREVEDLNEQYREYDLSPYTHPRYAPKEDRFFRTRRAQGHTKEEIRRDWQRLWKQCLREMYELALEKRKFGVKKMLNLPTDVRTPSPSPPRMMRSSYDYDRRMYANRYDDQRYMDMLEPIAPQVSSWPLGVISCLRLLTALEDQLGSLGPKAVQLLSRAVLTEKGGKNPNDLLMENDFYVFFMTAKEKLRGQLFADILDRQKTAAVTRACEDIDTLLEMFEEYMKRHGKSMPITAFDEGMKDDGGMSSSAPMFGNNNGSGGGSFGNNYSSGGSGDMGGLNNYSSGGGSGGGKFRSGSSGGVWQTGGSTSSSQIPPPLVTYPERSNMNKW